MEERLKEKNVEGSDNISKEEEEEIKQLAKFYVELSLSSDGNSQIHNAECAKIQDEDQECENEGNENPSSLEENLQRPPRATSALFPRQHNSNVRAMEQLGSSTSDTCLSSATLHISVQPKNWEKDAVCSSSGDIESNNSEKHKLKKQKHMKKTRFANEVKVLHYEQDSGDKYWTTEPLAEETDQQQRSYKNRDDRLDVTYPSLGQSKGFFSWVAWQRRGKPWE
uniref:Uncharacterized protein n=1 Tax=Rhodnius prolixus TaxID=13249 RepID=T1I0N8_RHOPR